MGREEKIKLLKAVNEGNIKVDNIPFQLAAMGLIDMIITMWHEIAPGIYQHKETGRVLKEAEPTKDIKPGEVIIRVKLFHHDGTKVPRLASSEKDIDLE